MHQYRTHKKNELRILYEDGKCIGCIFHDNITGPFEFWYMIPESISFSKEDAKTSLINQKKI